MTRDDEGNIVPQCEATYISGINHMYCMKERGHDGGHEDSYGRWSDGPVEAEQTDTDPT